MRETLRQMILRSVTLMLLVMKGDRERHREVGVGGARLRSGRWVAGFLRRVAPY